MSSSNEAIYAAFKDMADLVITSIGSMEHAEDVSVEQAEEAAKAASEIVTNLMRDATVKFMAEFKKQLNGGSNG